MKFRDELLERASIEVVKFNSDLNAADELAGWLEDSKYNDGKDYELFYERGDDVPNSMEVFSKKLWNDKEFQSLLSQAD